MPTTIEPDWPQHVRTLISNTNEVANLLKIHAVFTGGRRGRPRVPLEVLNKSAVVLLVACWEAFIEDLAAVAFDAMLTPSTSHDVFPRKVLALASKPLQESRNEAAVWALAQDGWRQVLLHHKGLVFDRYLGKFNTPRPRQVDELVESLIGMKDLSKSWKWSGRANSSVLKALGGLVTLRGEIAHRVETSRAVHKTYITHSLDLVNRIAAISSNQVLQYLERRIGRSPWIDVRYGKTG